MKNVIKNVWLAAMAGLLGTDEMVLPAATRRPTGRNRPDWHSDARVARATQKRAHKAAARQRCYDRCMDGQLISIIELGGHHA